MDKKLKKEIMIHLRKLGNREIKPTNKEYGMCTDLDVHTNINIRAAYIGDRFKHIYKTWPKYSGSINFPVPHPKLNSTQAYQIGKSLWDARTTYGKNRLELCLYIADRLEEELDSDV